MCEVSREASTWVGSGDLGREPLLIGGPSGIGNLLFGNGLGDGGVHCSSLSMESWSATAIRMN
jgi:hypothetical protein